jgi:flagellar hook-basal body complex protein FliE
MVAFAATAANAYAAVQAQANKAAANPGMGPGAGAGEAQGGFGQILQQVMGDAVSSSRHAEQAMAAQVQGKAELVDVVTAISSAEASLETVMAVRDQVIQAYQEIMRMPI